MAGATVRISETSRQLLRELAQQTDATMQDVIEEALAEYQKRLFWDQAGRDFTALRNDSEAWKDEAAERKYWDATQKDGLEDEDTP